MSLSITKELESSLRLAFAEAKARRHEHVTLEHLLYALLRDPIATVHRTLEKHLDSALPFDDASLGQLRHFPVDMLKVDPAMPDAEVTLEYLCDNIWIVGSPDTVARKLATLSDDVGGFGTLLVIAHEWTPRGAWERSMRLLKGKVVPRLRRRSRS